MVRTRPRVQHRRLCTCYSTTTRSAKTPPRLSIRARARRSVPVGRPPSGAGGYLTIRSREIYIAAFARAGCRLVVERGLPRVGVRVCRSLAHAGARNGNGCAAPKWRLYRIARTSITSAAGLSHARCDAFSSDRTVSREQFWSTFSGACSASHARFIAPAKPMSSRDHRASARSGVQAARCVTEGRA